MKFLLIFPITIIFLGCGCITSLEEANGNELNQKKNSASLHKVREPRIKKQWQDKFIDIVEKEADKGSTTWALFSYGGWVDQGQILIFSSANKKSIVKYASPASKIITNVKPLSKKDLKNFTANEKKFYQLKDFENEVMDGLQYEYVKVRKDQEGNVIVLQRTFMNNPGVGNPAVEYVNIVKSFNALKPTKK